MSRGYEQQRQDLVATFEHNKLELKAAVQDLTTDMRERVDEVRSRVDLRRHVVEDPAPWLAGSFGLGLLLGTRRWLVRTLRRAGF